MKKFPTIVIRTDGKRTVAKLMQGHKVLKQGIASCSPEDTFDFDTGVNLAMNRLREPDESFNAIYTKFEEPIEIYVRRYGTICETYIGGKLTTLEPDDFIRVNKTISFFDAKGFCGKLLCIKSTPNFVAGNVYEVFGNTSICKNGYPVTVLPRDKAVWLIVEEYSKTFVDMPF